MTFTPASPLTRQAVADQLLAYLHHEIPLAELVAWCEAAAFEAPAKKEKKVAMEAAREPEAAPSAGTVEGEKEAEAILSVPGEETEGGYTNGEAWKGGDLQERAPSSGRAFQRVKAEEWLDKKVRYSRDVLLCVVRW